VHFKKKRGWGRIKEEEERRRRSNQYKEKDISLIGTQLCYKGANVVSALLSTVTRPLAHVDLKDATIVGALLRT
jgi:hypothetical protein